MSLRVFPPPQLLEELVKDWYKFFVYLQNSPVKPSDPGLMFVESFKITDSISPPVIRLFKLSFSSWFSFGGPLFLETCPFGSGCQFCWHIIVHSTVLWFFFVFLGINYLLYLLFHFLTLLFSFFLVNLARGLSNLLIFSKNQILAFLPFF